MFNYIKWELKEFFYKSNLWFIVAGIICLLFLIIPIEENTNNFFSILIVLAIYILLFFSFFGSYFAGTKKVIDTFSKKTFLLESMIPKSVKEILLAKYILGIIIDFLFLLILITCMIVIGVKNGGINFFENIRQIFIDNNFIEFIKVSLLLFISSTTFMSLSILCYIIIKVIKPNKSNNFIGLLFAAIAFYTITFILGGINVLTNDKIFLSYLIYILISILSFFTTSHLIENKLEIYN